MSEPFTGQIEMFAFDFAPRNWMLCNGQQLSTRQYAALYALIGTAYGPNPPSGTFFLPDLRGRVPLGGTPQSRYAPGGQGGEELHRLTDAEVPPHGHMLMVNTTAAPGSGDYVASPNRVLGPTFAQDYTGKQLSLPLYLTTTPPPTPVAAAANALGLAGGQGHENRMPSLAINFCICVNGIFPTPP